jgi:hypothetical protein
MRGQQMQRDGTPMQMQQPAQRERIRVRKGAS